MTIYKSKVGWWLVIPLLFPIVFLVSSISSGNYLSAGFVLIGLLFFSDLFRRTDYNIDGAVLRIRSGLVVKKTISISSIRKIEPTDSILSAPALSMDRIVVRYNTYDEVVISPKEKKEFTEHLLRINPDIEIHL